MQEFQSIYLKNTRDIRELSNPPLIGDFDKKTFYNAYKENFRIIRNKAIINRDEIEIKIAPYLNKEKVLDNGLAAQLFDLADSLISDQKLMSVDCILGLKIHELLYEYYQMINDERLMVNQAVELISLYYRLMIIMNRTVHLKKEADKYRELGIFYCIKCKEQIENIENFKLLNEETRERVLRAYAFMGAFYNDIAYNEDYLRIAIAISKNVNNILKDWHYHKLIQHINLKEIKQLGEYYICKAVDYDYQVDIPKDILKTWLKASKALHVASENNENKLCPKWLSDVRYQCCRYLCNEIKFDEMINGLIKYYAKRDECTHNYDYDDILLNLYLPNLIINYLINKGTLNIANKKIIKSIYKSIIKYLRHIQKNDYFESLITYLGIILKSFVEIENGVTFMEFSQAAIATCHPSTYIHSISVASISKIIASKIIEQDPSSFIGILNTKDISEVKKKANDILDFVYHCGVFHDVGKILFVDVISEYHRPLFDEEFNIIKKHPILGYDMLIRNKSTSKYSDIALAHHIWNDATNGYPISENMTYNNQIIIDIISVADCLDAATDTVFRSFNKGISLSEFTSELRANSGTRYSAMVVELFDDQSFVKKIKKIVEDGRENAYYKMFILYEEVLDGY